MGPQKNYLENGRSKFKNYFTIVFTVFLLVEKHFIARLRRALSKVSILLVPHVGPQKNYLENGRSKFKNYFTIVFTVFLLVEKHFIARLRRALSKVSILPVPHVGPQKIISRTHGRNSKIITPL